MTEIPEHLLKRSRERRSAAGLGGDEAGTTAAPAAATPATTAKAPAAAAAPSGPAKRAAAAAAPSAPKPKPDSAVVAAYKKRRRVPFWAMAALGLLPVWGFMYARAVTAQPVEASGPLAVGEAAYSSCASCHGSGGAGVGATPGFTDGRAEANFPHIEDMLRWVYFGSQEYANAGVEIYGNPELEGGPRLTGSSGGVMPGWGANAGGAFTDAQILGVVCHERYTFGGADQTSEEFAKWCSPDSEIFHELETGAASLPTLHETEIGADILPIGNVPVEGSAP